jgi:hypothetical protein
MVHHWRWHGSTRVPRWTRSIAAVGLLFACVLLAGMPAAASAAEPDVRGEWALTVTSSAGTLHGKALITQEANVKGEFAAHETTWEGAVAGTFTGTLEGAKATVKTTSEAFPPILPPGEFKSKAMTVEAGASSLSLSGEGTLTLGAAEMPATETLVRVKTLNQIEHEKREQEEAEARDNVRGEWTVTLESAFATLKGKARITQAANAKNEFASSSALFEGVLHGSFSGTLEGSKATVTVTTEGYGEIPPGTFTSSNIAVTSASNPTSMSGPGTFKAGASEFPATLTATRVLTYQQLVVQEKTEQEAREKQEKEAQEAAEKAAREKQEKELKERQEREAREAAGKVVPKGTPTTPLPTPSPLVSVLLSSKTLTLSHGGTLSLNLANPNGLPVRGHVKLTLAGKTSGVKHKSSGSSTLGEASFSISGKGNAIVKVKLSASGRAQLARLKALRVVLTLTTQASGQPNAIKSYKLTLHATKPARKH